MHQNRIGRLISNSISPPITPTNKILSLNILFIGYKNQTGNKINLLFNFVF